jgi:DNA-binding NarL/FixJ family response regulator
MSAWVSHPALRDLLGETAATALCTHHGGVALYVPRTAMADSKLARIIGLAALQELCAAYAGEWITVPNARKTAPRKVDVMRLLDAGVSPAQIALQLGLTERYVRHVASAYKPAPKQLSLPL